MSDFCKFVVFLTTSGKKSTPHLVRRQSADQFKSDTFRLSSPPLPANEIAPHPLIPTIHSLFPPPVGQIERRDPHYSAPLNSARRARERASASSPPSAAIWATIIPLVTRTVSVESPDADGGGESRRGPPIGRKFGRMRERVCGEGMGSARWRGCGRRRRKWQ